MAWLTGYTYRKLGAVNSTAAGAQTLYQLKLVVGESSGASGADVHCENHCVNFPNDIRFTKADEVTKHDYWVDVSSLTGSTPNRKVDVWIEVATIPASGAVNFYIYYYKESDSGESDGDSAFNFFDDFVGRTIVNEKYLTSWTESGNNPLQSKTCQNWLIAVYSNYNNEDKIYIFEQRNSHPNNTIEAWSFTRANAATPANWTNHGVVFTGTGAHDNGHIEPHGIIFETQSMADAREGGSGTRKWRLYYCAKGAGEDTSKYSANFAYASESNLTSWTAYSGNPVYDHDAEWGFADSKVCIYDNKVWLFHCKYKVAWSCDPAFFSVSSDGISNWTDKTKNWHDENAIGGTPVAFNSGIMLYGHGGTPDTMKMYFTPDGDNKATCSDNPVFTEVVSWRSIVVDKGGNPNLNDAGTYYMYYMEGGTNNLSLATSVTYTEESEFPYCLTDNWTITGLSHSITDGVLRLYGGEGFDTRGIHTKTYNHPSSGAYIEWRAKLAGSVGAARGVGSIKTTSAYYKGIGGLGYYTVGVLKVWDYNGASATTAAAHDADTWYRMRTELHPGKIKIVRLDDSLSVEKTNTLESHPVGIYVGYEAYLDFIAVRKYALPEPTWGGWGAEASETQTYTKTFTADAVMVNWETKTFTVDAALEATFAKTFSVNALISKAYTKTFIVDAHLSESKIRTFSVDVILSGSGTKVFSCDAFILNKYTKTFSIDSVLSGSISGITRNSDGSPLGTCVVWLFKTSDKSYVDSTTSNESGEYSFNSLLTGIYYFIRSSKDGSPNVFGTTDDNLEAS